MGEGEGAGEPSVKGDAASAPEPGSKARIANEAGVVSALTRGPRGLRTLLEFAIRSEQAALRHPDSIGPLDHLVDDASHHRDDSSVAMLYTSDGRRAIAPPPPDPPLARIAEAVDDIPLAEPMEHLLRRCVADAVTTARYWQGMDGRDVVAATPPVREALIRVAEHLASSPVVQAWFDDADPGRQHLTRWDGEEPTTIHDPPGYEENARRALLEQRADWDSSLTGGSGIWWTTPSPRLESTTGQFSDGAPMRLWLEEDDFGYESADAQRIATTQGRRILEVRSQQDWVDLCRRHPLEPRRGRRGNWHACTGEAGPWMMPDWSSVAEVADGAHLSLGAYLDLAGRAVPVEGITARHTRLGRPRTALTLVAGWHPDATYWFHDPPAPVGDPEPWRFVDTDDGPDGLEWMRAGDAGGFRTVGS
ncbi:hypothetical protein DEO23_04650 [Brachybacterium endophyticum]|uniref:Uncharacterized protein n=1 Tax=Brachybacterium endophyticum TaxID=2182385 RepID=A0A2U2RK96_9MICO|nr:hypothetical protein [Brachybacterium endophyticum]PWH06280.1 hypothetical protein DEO23_04650 [Brachybacterium endophyticum]